MGDGDGLIEGPTENVWQRVNFWMVEEAVALAPERTLIALWDGKGGDGPGGTDSPFAAAFAARYNAARSSSITDSCRSAQIINSFGEVAFVQLKLAAREMTGKPARSATAYITQVRFLVIDV